MALANSSFPVPLSPVIKMVASVGAAIPAVSITSFMAGLVLMMREKPVSADNFFFRSAFSRVRCRWLMARSMVSFRSSKFNGLVR